mgnify:CR=1 FL=1
MLMIIVFSGSLYAAESPRIEKAGDKIVLGNNHYRYVFSKSYMMAGYSGTKFLDIPGTLGHWRFDSGKGNEVSDLGPGRYTAELQDVSWVIDGDSKIPVLEFDGKKSMVEVADTSAFNLTSSMTIEVWVKPSPDLASVPNAFLITKDSQNSDTYYTYSMKLDYLKPSVLLTINDKRRELSVPEKLSADCWSLLAFTYDGEKGRIYVNGSLKAEHQYRPGKIGTTNLPLHIGMRAKVQDTGSYAYKGRIGEVRILSQALSGEELLKDYKNSLGASSTPGFTLEELVNRATGENYIKQSDKSRFFGLLVEEDYIHQEEALKNYAALVKGETKELPFYGVKSPKVVYGEDFQLDKVDIGGGAKEARIWLSPIDSSLSLEVELEVKIDESPVTLWSLKVTNKAVKPRRISVAFPIISGIRIGDDIDKNWYIWPLLGTAPSNYTADLVDPLGGSADLQFLDIWNLDGGGIFLRPNSDPEKMKYFVLQKVVKDKPILVHHRRLWQEISDSRVAALYDGVLKGLENSLTLAINFQLDGEIPAGGIYTTPQMAIGIHSGDFHVAMDNYRGWVNTWFKRAWDPPEWLIYDTWVGRSPYPHEAQGDWQGLLKRMKERMPYLGVSGVSENFFTAGQQGVEELRYDYDGSIDTKSTGSLAYELRSHGHEIVQKFHEANLPFTVWSTGLLVKGTEAPKEKIPGIVSLPDLIDWWFGPTHASPLPQSVAPNGISAM